MFDIDLYKEIWQAISKNKMRSFLTAFGVFWGLFMLIALSGAGNGLQTGIETQMKGFATNAAFIWTENTSKPYKGFKKGRSWDMDNGDMEAIIQNVPEIEYLVPRLQGWKQNTTNNTMYNNRYGTFYLNGDYPNLANVEPFNMTQGRFINEIDIRETRKVCVIGPDVAEVLFKHGEDPLGEYIRVSGVYFQVIGVFKTSNNISFGYDKRKAIHIPFTTMQRTFNYGNSVHFFSFTAQKDIPVSVAEEKIRSILRKRHDIAPDDLQAVGGFNIENEFKMLANLFLGVRILIFIVGLGTLLAGIIGISNIMLVIVKERTKEIGVKRALGATPGNIIQQILLESVLLTTIAGYLGLALGVLLNEGIGAAFAQDPDNIFLNPQIDLKFGLSALLILVIAGTLAGLLPANRAVRVKPIDAIRDE